MFSDYNNSILIAIIYIVVLMCCVLLCIFPGQIHIGSWNSRILRIVPEPHVFSKPHGGQRAAPALQPSLNCDVIECSGSRDRWRLIQLQDSSSLYNNTLKTVTLCLT